LEIVERMYLKELLVKLNRKDYRTVEKWCTDRNVYLYKEGGNNFVIKSEFILAYNLPYINSLKKQHKDNWEYYFELSQNNELYKTLESNGTKSMNKRYQPKSDIAKKISQ